jgi:hypothetical protein
MQDLRKNYINEIPHFVRNDKSTLLLGGKERGSIRLSADAPSLLQTPHKTLSFRMKRSEMRNLAKRYHEHNKNKQFVSNLKNEKILFCVSPIMVDPDG